MRMSDLQQKDIINTKDGKKLGKINDVLVNERGEIEYLIIGSSKFFKKYSGFAPETKIRFNQIVNFGADVILVDLMI